MSTGESFESRFEKIDVTLKDPKSEVNVDCLLVSRERRWAPGHVSPNSLPCGTESHPPGWVTALLSSALVFCLLGLGLRVRECARVPGERLMPSPASHLSPLAPRTALCLAGCHRGGEAFPQRRNSWVPLLCVRAGLQLALMPVLSPTTFLKTEVLSCCG